MKKNLVARSLKEFESMDAREQKMALEIMKMKPEALKIAKPTIAGNEATFKAEGKEGGSVSTGTVRCNWKTANGRCLRTNGRL